MGAKNLVPPFTISFQIKPRARKAGWHSILHYGNSNGIRAPGIWFYPGRTRLHIRVGRRGNGNDGCDPGRQLPLNKWTKVTVEVGKNFVKWWSYRI